MLVEGTPGSGRRKVSRLGRRWQEVMSLECGPVLQMLPESLSLGVYEKPP